MKIAKHVGRYLAVGDNAWATRRRLTVASVGCSWLVVFYATLVETDRGFATSLVNNMTNVMLAFMTLYGGGATAVQGIKEYFAAKSAPARARPAGGD